MNFDRLNTNNDFSNIRNDPRFQAILKKLKDQKERLKIKYDPDFYWNGVGKELKG
jgi:hypothetical protein